MQNLANVNSQKSDLIKNYCATEYANEGVGPLNVLRENEYKESSQIRTKWNEDILTT